MLWFCILGLVGIDESLFVIGVELKFFFGWVGHRNKSAGGSVGANLNQMKVHREFAFLLCPLLNSEQFQHRDTAGQLIADLRDETAVFVDDSAVQKPASVVRTNFHLVFYCGLGKVFSSEVVAEFVVIV